MKVFVIALSPFIIAVILKFSLLVIDSNYSYHLTCKNNNIETLNILTKKAFLNEEKGTIDFYNDKEETQSIVADCQIEKFIPINEIKENQYVFKKTESSIYFISEKDLLIAKKEYRNNRSNQNNLNLILMMSSSF